MLKLSQLLDRHSVPILPISTRPLTTRTGYVRTGPVTGAEHGAPVRRSISPWHS
jgi:hypothetical protein